MAHPTVSFELFPPKSEEGLQKLKQTITSLNAANPSYYSVTYGAAGSTQKPTYDTVNLIRNDFNIPVVPHLTCVGHTQSEIKKLVQEYLDLGIDKLVILRGDLPSGYAAFDGDFRHAVDLVKFIRENFSKDLILEVAAYPECHPQAKNLQIDINHFKAKVDAGANAAITQYFYNIESYKYFVDEVREMGGTLPIIPGIMPITNLERLQRFSAMCGAEVPQWIVRRLEGYTDDPASLKAFGVEVVSNLCRRLLEEGAPELHFYTLNTVEPTLSIVENLSLSGGTNADT